jgi:hypothetical protein
VSFVGDRASIIAWLKRLETASKDPEARRDLDRVLSLANNTIGALRRAIERGDYSEDARPIGGGQKGDGSGCTGRLADCPLDPKCPVSAVPGREGLPGMCTGLAEKTAKEWEPGGPRGPEVAK